LTVLLVWLLLPLLLLLIGPLVLLGVLLAQEISDDCILSFRRE
jgi:hypothetical protein